MVLVERFLSFMSSIIRRRSGVMMCSHVEEEREGVIDSRDVRRHVDWILDRLAEKDEILARLQEEGNRMDIFCYVLSVTGHGGPTLSPAIMRRLGELELEIGFDIYGPYDA